MSNIDWQADLDQLANALPILHKNLFFNQEKDMFYNNIVELKERVSKMDNYTIALEIAQIVAAIGDAHTSVALPRYNRLPLECYWFQEGIFITATLPEFKNQLHSKIVKIDGMPINNVIECLSGIVSHENQSFLMSRLPDYLICADILFGLYITDSISEVKMTLENQNNDQYDSVISTIKYSDWKTESLYEGLMRTDTLPLYRRNPNKYFWSEFDPEKNLLYINYNNCKDMPDITVEDFANQLIKDIKSNEDIQKVIIDLRNNGGGNSDLFMGFLNWLSTFDRLNYQGRLFIILGRDTFSSALLNAYFLKFNTRAIFLGEPTGGKPNCYGEVKYFSLTSSGLHIRYSTAYYKLVDDDSLLSFMPDVKFEVKFKDYIKGIDPPIEWVV